MYSELVTINSYNTAWERNPRCENNLGDVDKYRYSVALVEFWFRTDTALHQGLV